MGPISREDKEGLTEDLRRAMETLKAAPITAEKSDGDRFDRIKTLALEEIVLAMKAARDSFEDPEGITVSAMTATISGLSDAFKTISECIYG